MTTEHEAVIKICCLRVTMGSAAYKEAVVDAVGSEVSLRRVARVSGLHRDTITQLSRSS